MDVFPRSVFLFLLLLLSNNYYIAYRWWFFFFGAPFLKKKSGTFLKDLRRAGGECLKGIGGAETYNKWRRRRGADHFKSIFHSPTYFFYSIWWRPAGRTDAYCTAGSILTQSWREMGDQFFWYTPSGMLIESARSHSFLLFHTQRRPGGG